MRIKIVKNGVESEWFELTKQQHRTLLEDKPEAAIVYIEDLYPQSPDSGQLVRLEFTVFSALAREFVLIENCQIKRAERHHDQRTIDAIDANENHALFKSVEDEYLCREWRKKLDEALDHLTPTQRRRLILSVDYGMSHREIAKVEGTSYSSITESIQAAKNKIKKFLEHTPSNRGFLSD